MPSVIIIGGGISGLALAFRIQQRAPSAEITLLEERARPGGTLWTERRDGFQVEIGPNGFLDTKPTTADLCRDIGLGERLIAADRESARNRYLFQNGRLKPLPTGLGSFLRTDLLSWRGKLSFLLERFRPQRRDGAPESIDTFARRRYGTEVADVLADALVAGIYAGDPALLSVRASFPRLVALEEEHGSVLKGMVATARRQRAEAAAAGRPYRRPGTMWSFREGLRPLAEALAGSLRQPPLLGAAARRIEQTAGPGSPLPRWTVHGDGRERWDADAVVLACPAYRQETLLAEVDRELAERVGGIPYNRVAVVALGYRRADVPRPLDGFGFLVPQRTRRDLLGVQWCSSLFPDRAPAGAVLLRAMCGGWHRPDIVGWDDARLLAAVRAELGLAMGITARPVFHHIVRWDRAIPQYVLGHPETVAWIEERAGHHPGLFLGGNCYRGVALNDCTEQAQVLAGRVAAYLEARPPR
jgi:oxygen-dependent protoporphyrinogen oxidase